MSKTVTMNVKVKDYTSRVLGVVKEKYGLKDKAAALDKFVQMHGQEYVDEEMKEEYIQKLLNIEEAHFKSHGYRHTSISKLREEIEGE